MQATRRRFFSLAGATPIAAKVAADSAVLGLVVGPVENASLSLSYGGPPASVTDETPYERRVIGASDYVRMFGVPEVLEFELRDRSRHVYSIETDIANKRSWSVSVKVAVQRQRNYDREVEKISRSGFVARGRGALKKFLGFDWPW
jgi:hypothetical protein